MSSLQHKVDFAVILTVDHANPNGDPLNGNRPRTDYDGFGEISDVCIKRKIRDRLLEKGHKIFVQSDDRKVDGMSSLKERAESAEHGLGKEAFSDDKKREQTAKAACEKWFDVRAFGQLFAFKTEKKKSKKNADAEGVEEFSSGGVSIPIRGPVSIQSAFSIEPVSVASIQITKSVSGEGDGSKRSSDTMGMKHRVDKGVYVFYGSMNPQLAERTTFSDQDAVVIKEILPQLFENDASSARPEGSMAVTKVIWWKHNCKSGQYSSAKVHGTLQVNPDGTYQLQNLEGLVPEEIDGF
jgi:CRISPR-associated protein Csd2